MTLGVRAVLLKEDQVVLVRHSYMPGWHFPGGGVEAGESFHAAMVREIREEAGAELTGPADLFGVYRNGPANPRDHVALFICRHWQQPVSPKPNLEIRACETFPLDALPEGMTPGTFARLAEIRDNLDPSVDW
jgi:ADP-ribose pyrophosphatase YjhB (NUDIX family)